MWRHGDWILFTERGSCVITGRSDATLNRGGVRMGTGEFYEVVEELDEVLDSLVVHLEDAEGGAGELLLFVVLRDGATLDDDLRARIGARCARELSPRHVPDTVEAVPAIPRTLTGKKLELPVKRMLRGADQARVASRDALADPTAIDAFVAYARVPHARRLSRAPLAADYNRDIFVISVSSRAGRAMRDPAYGCHAISSRRCGSPCAGSAGGHAIRGSLPRSRPRWAAGGPRRAVRFTFRQKYRCVVRLVGPPKVPHPWGECPRTRRRRHPSPRPAVAANVTSARHEGTH